MLFLPINLAKITSKRQYTVLVRFWGEHAQNVCCCDSINCY